MVFLKDILSEGHSRQLPVKLIKAFAASGKFTEDFALATNQVLATLNQGFAQVLQNLHKLEELDFLRHEFFYRLSSHAGGNARLGQLQGS
jgi:hypothetical protein